MTRVPVSIVAVLLIAVVALTSCSSTSDDTTTTVVDDEAAQALAVEQMCRTLSILVNANASPGHASEGMAATDLDGATPDEMATYGDILVLAPRTSCPEFAAYADEIAYWLGY